MIEFYVNLVDLFCAPINLWMDSIHELFSDKNDIYDEILQFCSSARE